MASRCSRFLQKSFISTLKSAISKPVASSLDRSATTSFTRSSMSSKSVISPLRRCCLSRSPAELGGVASMLPLHSAVATARLTSCLSSTSRSCRALSQAEQEKVMDRNSLQHCHKISEYSFRASIGGSRAHEFPNA